MRDAESGLHPEFYIGLHTMDSVQLRDTGRTPISRGPFPSFGETRDFPPLIRPSGGVESIGPLCFPATPPLGSHFGPLLRGAVGTRTLQVSGDLCKPADAAWPERSLPLTVAKSYYYSSVSLVGCGQGWKIGAAGFGRSESASHGVRSRGRPGEVFACRGLSPDIPRCPEPSRSEAGSSSAFDTDWTEDSL